MTVSLIVVLRNAGKYLPALFADILAQDINVDDWEIIFVDGMSKDNTPLLVREFKANNPCLTVAIIDNPGEILSSGWNVALAHAKGDILLRIDAHARMGKGFIRKNVELIRKGENIVGGYVETIAPSNGFGVLSALADTSCFCGGMAAFRNPGKARYVDTLAYAAYRREIFAKVGGYDERLVRTEDNEMHYRMKKAGFKFYYSPAIKSCRYSRPDLRGLLKQKYGNGYWVALTIPLAPRCFSLRHLAPVGFLLAIVSGVGAGRVWGWWPLLSMMSLYLLLACGYAFKAGRLAASRDKLSCLLLPGIFFLEHIFYGLGTLAGMFAVPGFVMKHRGYKIPRPI